ncbi:MAG: hypothetical protein M1820_005021 [Bogoriella megaspora]|nr:MAG: hypothetical protein M1820_005021 [Bogoriella megaspora]
MAAPAHFKDSWYEHDPRWTAVDAYTLSSLHPASKPNSTSLTSCLSHSLASGLPDISASPSQGKFLALQCLASRATHALEVGTLGGYTAIWLTSMNPKLHLTTVEVDPHHAKIARENLERAGVGERVEIVVGEGVEVLPRLKEEVRKGERERVGFAWIDADKENNWRYLQEVVEMAEKGASVLVDNVVRRGALIDEKQRGDEAVEGGRRVVEGVGRDERVEGIVVQTVGEKNYDGFLMAVVL